MIRGPCTQPRLIASRSASVAPLVAEVADGGEAGAERLHAVHLRFERIHLRLLADEGQQPRLAAAVGVEMDMAVDQAGKHGLVAKVDRRRAGSAARHGRRVTATIRPPSTTIVDGPRTACPGTAISRPAWI